MKKTGIMNHWMVNNYGALLLAYALEKKLIDLGYDVETISYLPDEVLKPWRTSMIPKIGVFQYFLRLGYFCVFILPRQKNFSKLRAQMRTSLAKYTDRTICQISNQYEKILIGGDQLWNCKINYYNKNNFLPFIREKNRKIVYAASLSQDKMREGFEEEFRELAEGFGYVTTRERRATELIEELTNLSAPRVADPAFLLDVQEWEALAKPYNQQEKYIFVYQVQSDAIIPDFSSRLAKEKNLKIIYCPFPLKKFIRCKRKPYISPEQWLGYIKNAEYIVTDAFHGLVFSIIFNKKFAVEISDYGRDTGSRITNLLELFGLEDRLLTEEHLLDIEKPIDYTAINKKIIADRENSIQHIHAMMNI